MAYDGSDFSPQNEVLLLEREGRILGRAATIRDDRISVIARSAGVLERLKIVRLGDFTEYRLRQRIVYPGEMILLVKRPMTFWDWLFRCR